MDYKIKPIWNVIALLTNQCNLACPYCFEDRDVRRMTFETARGILDFIHKSERDIHGFTFFGGEPTLEWDTIIVPLVQYSKTLKKQTRFAMTTNGTLLTPDKIDWLHNNQVNFMLSMDGNKLTQDTNRPMRNGESGFDKLAVILPYALRVNPRQIVRITISPETVGNLYDDILFFENNNVRRLAALPNFFARWTSEQYNILAEQIQRYESHIVETFQHNQKPLLFNEYMSAFWRLSSIMQRLPRRTHASCQRGAQCGMGVKGSASADVDGNLYACHHISPLVPESDWCIGNIRDGIDEQRIHALINTYDPQQVGNTQCSECPLDNICDGGCCCNNYMICGDVNKVPESFCYWMRLVTDSAYRVSIILQDNPLFIETFQRGRKGIID